MLLYSSLHERIVGGVSHPRSEALALTLQQPPEPAVLKYVCPIIQFCWCVWHFCHFGPTFSGSLNGMFYNKYSVKYCKKKNQNLD